MESLEGVQRSKHCGAMELCGCVHRVVCAGE